MKDIFKKYTPFQQVLIFVGIGSVAFVLVSIIVNIIIGGIYPQLPENNQILIAQFPIAFIFLKYLPFQVGFLLIPGIIYWSHTKELNKIKTHKKIGYNWVWAILLFLCVFLLLPLFTSLNLSVTDLFGATEQLQNIKNQADKQMAEVVGSLGSTTYYLSLLTIGVITGFAEELAFRRFLFHHILLNTKNLWKSLIASAFIFALLHFNYIQLLPLFIFGLALALMYYKTKSILPGIIAHTTNNCINLYWLATGNYPLWLNEINLWIIIPSVIITIALTYLLFRENIKNRILKG